MPLATGHSAVVIPVPAAEAVVSTWRARFDPSAARGMPAHITLLYPFLPADRLTADVVEALRELSASAPVAELRFRRTARFPGVLYLEPEPGGWIREMTTSIAQRWPDARPYGGEFDEVIPHLTIALADEARVLDEIEADVLVRLPIATSVETARLYVFDGERWKPGAALPFRGSR